MLLVLISHGCGACSIKPKPASLLVGSADKLLAKNEVTDGTLLRLFDERLGLFALSADVFGHRSGTVFGFGSAGSQIGC